MPAFGVSVDAASTSVDLYSPRGFRARFRGSVEARDQLEGELGPASWPDSWPRSVNKSNRFKSKPLKLLTFRLPLKRLRLVKSLTPQSYLGNRTQEADGSIPFSSTTSLRILSLRCSEKAFQRQTFLFRRRFRGPAYACATLAIADVSFFLPTGL